MKDESWVMVEEVTVIEGLNGEKKCVASNRRLYWNDGLSYKRRQKETRSGGRKSDIFLPSSIPTYGILHPSRSILPILHPCVALRQSSIQHGPRGRPRILLFWM